eukprot:TRINITY_DN67392_c0_g1_i1.p1 TRINITY_DN67392_c0_g1~~TRINITY_DN67392_c0_g1_i1.p1  ORF type:complete len:552 (-),score=99.25 TRINITY_DN67392_c0_g1_i1:4-1638(-)
MPAYDFSALVQKRAESPQRNPTELDHVPEVSETDEKEQAMPSSWDFSEGTAGALALWHKRTSAALMADAELQARAAVSRLQATNLFEPQTTRPTHRTSTRSRPMDAEEEADKRRPITSRWEEFEQALLEVERTVNSERGVREAEREKIRKEQERLRAIEEEKRRKAEEERARAEAEEKRRKEEEARKAREAAQAREEEERKAKELAQAKAQAATQAAQAAAAAQAALSQQQAAAPPGPANTAPQLQCPSGTYTPELGQAVYERLHKEYEPREEKLKSQRDDPVAKKQLAPFSKEIVRCYGLLSDCTKAKAKDVLAGLCALIESQRAPPTEHLHYILSATAKKFIGDLQQPYGPRAPALGAILAHLCVRYPEFAPVYLNRLCAICPLAAPADGQVEGADGPTVCSKTTEALILHSHVLLAHVDPTLLPNPQGLQASNYVGIHAAWRWLASLLNMPKDVIRRRRDVWAAAAATFVKLAAHDLVSTYGYHAAKLLDLVESQFIPILEDNVTDTTAHAGLMGALQQLKETLSAYKSGNLLPSPRELRA